MRLPPPPWGGQPAQLAVPQPRGRSPRHETASIWVFWGLFRPPHTHTPKRAASSSRRGATRGAFPRRQQRRPRALAWPRPPRATIGCRRTGEWRAALAIGCGREQARGGAENKEVTCGGGAAAAGRAPWSRPGAPGLERAGGVVPGRLLALVNPDAMPSRGLERRQFRSRETTPL